MRYPLTLRSALWIFLIGYGVCALPVYPTPADTDSATRFLAIAVSVGCYLVLLESALKVEVPESVLVSGMLGSLGVAVALRTFLPAGFFTDLAFDLNHAVLALSLGRLLVNRVEFLWWLVPLGLVGCLADILSVFSEHGFTRKMVESDSVFLDYALLTWPMFSTGPPEVYMGVADMVFATLFIGVGQRFGIRSPAVLAAVYTGMMGAVAVAYATGIGIPVTPFMIVVFTIWHHQKLLGSYQLEPGSPGRITP